MFSPNNKPASRRRLWQQSQTNSLRVKSRLRFIPQIMELEDRCLLSFTPTLVPNQNTKSLDQVLATPANLPSKLVTIMNNSNEVVYPILQDPNSTLDGTAGKVVRLVLKNGGTGYSSKKGEGPTVQFIGGGGSGAVAEAVVNGDGEVYAINLTAGGGGYTSLPTIKFVGGGGKDADATAVISNLKPNAPDTSLYDPLDPFNQAFRGYIGEYDKTTKQTNFGLQPGHQVTVEVPLVFWDGGRLFLASNGGKEFQTDKDPGMPLQNTPAWTFEKDAASFLVAPDQRYSANFPDPATGVANENGRVMWYHAATPHDFATDAAGQLTEWTIRDQKLPTWAPNMPSSQVLKIFNYDVSYVDNLTLPAGMEITKVPIQTPPKYNGKILSTSNYAVLGTDLTIDQMQQGMKDFTKTDPTTLNSDLGNYFGGRGYDQFYFPTGPGGINFDKLPAGYNLIALSPNAQVASSYDAGKFQLISGGTYASVNTISTGIAKKGSNQITGASAAQVAQLVAGMQYQIVNFPIKGGTTPIFPQGTYITGVSGTTITMSSPASQDGPSQTGTDLISYTFVGSRFTSSKGKTDGSTAAIDDIDPATGIYLRPGMLVTGPGITTYTTILSVADDYKSVKLTGAIPTMANGAYVFTGSPASYVVQTLINNWYSWADYYVNNIDVLPPAQPVKGSTYGPGPKGLEDPNALTLYDLDKTVVEKLRVGDSVTGPNIPSHPLSTAFVANTGINYKVNDILTVQGGTFAKVATLKVVGVDLQGHITGIAIQDPGSYTTTPTDQVAITGGSGTGATFLLYFSPNTTISAILSPTSVQLSNPVPNAVVGGMYTFTKPEAIVRSSDAQPYTLTFSTDDQKKTALDFSRTVYDVMVGFSHLNAPTYLSRSALLVDYVIGGNIGTFILQGQKLPELRLNQLRDGLKSVLRGVANFDETPEFNPVTGVQQWYPNPSQGTPGAMINGVAAKFGVYNLNPYVWFIHVKLGMSGYGFSLDDDTANAQDASDSLQLGYGGTRYTAANVVDAQKLINPELYTFGAPFGTLQDTGHIDVTSGVAKGYDLTKYTVISGLSLATVGKLKAFDAKNGQGALVTGFGMTPGKSRVYYVGPANPVPNEPDGKNASYVVLQGKSPDKDGPDVTYTFSGFSTVLADGTQLASPVPAIASFAPTTGAPGTTVTLTGMAFMPGTNAKALGVTFNGIAAKTFTVNSDASITVTVPDKALSGLIGVRGPAGTGYTGGDFTVTGGAAPTITSFSPPNGSLGTVVTIMGTGFTGTSKVTFNGTPSINFSVTNETTLKATVPIGATTGKIVVTAPGGIATSLTDFTVNAPNVVSFSPPSGPVGTEVTLTGAGFKGASSVTFNLIAAASFTVVDDTTIKATVAAGTTTGKIAVTTSGGTGSSATDFIITAPVQPSITSFSPPSGPIGTDVTLTGTGFTGVSSVTFNKIAATFTFVDDKTIKATVPTLATTGKIEVTTPGGTGTSATDFTVTQAAKPVITSFSPGTGSAGDPVTLTGTGFTGVSHVRFNGVEASFLFVSDTKITTSVPSLATTGPISVTTPPGTGESKTNFIIDQNVPAQIKVSSGSPQSTSTNKAFADPFKALVTDASGSPISGVNVQFVAPSSGASGTFAGGGTSETVMTGADGVATSSVFTANARSGSYVVTANVSPALATPAKFMLDNLSADERFVNALYVSFVGRRAASDELDRWVAALPSLGRSGVVNGIMRSEPALRRLVDSIYTRFLGREANDNEEKAWANAIRAGSTTEEVLISTILASAEFGTRAMKLYPSDQTNPAYIKALFKLLLNREADSTGLANWVRALQTQSRAQVASAFQATALYRGGMVRTIYGDPTLSPLPFQPFFVNLLHRKTAPTPAEVNGWVNSGQDILSIQAVFAASDEFFNNA